MAVCNNRSIEKHSWVQNFEVSQPVKHKKGFTVYKVVSTVFSKPFPESVTKLIVWKRFNDFKKLHKEMQMIHKQLYLSGDFPKFPQSRVFGRFDYDVVEERKKSALALLNFAATHAQLYTSKTFVKFFESGYEATDLSEDVINSTTNGNNLENITDNCLIPERVWEEPSVGSNRKQKDADHVSVNSIMSSSPDSPTLTDSDSLLSESILSISSEAFLTSQPTNLPMSSSDFVLNSKPSSSSASQQTERKSNNAMISSSSLIEDLRSTLEDEANEIDSVCSMQGVSNSVSCSSLTTLPLNKSASVSTGSLSAKKSPNGFSFFDFLPIFPKKLQKQKASEDKLFADSLTASYICEAAGHFAVAQHHESISDLENAFASYKEGIGILLAGAKSDTDQKRKLLVRNKLDKYLKRAESLHTQHLSSTSETNDVDLLFSPANELRSLIKSESATKESPSFMEPSDIRELKKYKVVGFAPNKNLVVVNMSDNIPKCFAVKVMTKSSCLVDPEKPTIIPTNVPFMVNLVRWFDTENSVVLLMQYAGGGQLIDFVRTYQTKQIAIISHGCSPTNGDYNSNDLPMLASTSNFARRSQDSVTVLAAMSQLRRDNAKLELPNKNSLKGESEKDPEEKARKSNLESGCKSAKGSEIETKECDGCPTFPCVCESKTGNGNWDNDETEGRHHHYEPHQKVPIDSQILVLPKPEKEKFTIESETRADSSCRCDNEYGGRCSCVHHDLESISKPNSDLPLSCRIVNNLSLSEIVSLPTSSQNTCKHLDLVDTHELIESSKVLIQTVSNTLAQGRVAHICSNSEACESKANFIESCKNNGNGDTCSEQIQPINELRSHSKYDKICGNGQKKIENNINNNTPNEIDGQGDTIRNGLTLEGFNENISGDNGCAAEHENGDGNMKLARKLKRQCRSQEFPVESSENESDSVAALKRMVPECCIKVWAAEMILALETLHTLGLTYGDLDMRNVLLGKDGHILLSFTSQWSEVDQVPLWSEFSAPEARNHLRKSIWKLHSSSDWWSLGAILFLLLTGQSLKSAHPEGFHAQTVLKIPKKNICGDCISSSARTLLAELLNFSPELRLGFYGAEEIKSHPFFENFDWDAAMESFQAEQIGD